MPNFITQSVSLPPLPIKIGEVEFLETARGRNLTLVRTKSFDSEFFITLKPGGGKVIVKGEKITKPAKIGHLQRALEIFKERFCGQIISQAFAYKDSSLTEKTPLILDENEILSLVKSSKFNKIFIEIGFGSGRHLLHQARSNQDALLIGIEIYKPAIEQVAKLAIREDLQNIALIATDARVLLSLLPAGCLQRVFLHFPVPWDDAPHRRVISDEFASQIARTLELGGRFELRTDSEEYFLYAMQKLSPYVQRKAGEISHFKNRDAAVASKYEDRWRKMDKDIYDLIYENKTAGLGEPQQFEMEFLKFDAAAIARNFKNFTFKGEDFFVHFEEIFYFDAQKSLDAGGTCAADGVNLSGACEAINNGEAINLDATRGGNLTERASMDEISSGGGKISATTAGDKILTCANTTQIPKKASAPLNTNRADEAGAKDDANLNEDRLNASGVDLTSDVPVAVSAKFSRPAPSEKRALACEQVATSSTLNASGTEGALAAIDTTGTSTTPAAIGTIDTNNVPNAVGSFSATSAIEESATPNATRTDEANVTQILKKASDAPNTNHADETGANLNEDRLSTNGVNLTDGGAANAKNTTNASAASYENEPQAELKNELNHTAEPQAELQNKSNSIKSQVGYRSEPSHDELQAERQGKLNRAEQQCQGKPSRVKSQDEWQSEPSCTEPQNERQSKSGAAEPQDVLILLSLGAFDFPQQCFIRANASGTRYFIRRPLPTRENHAAHQKISEIFSQWQR
ncbi:tRNA (guanosine(46)-N7)-methyltransferase TrmB [uncultured Campylobacter sp.]|uniref:tRNA (guanosine(46)-N7)-methyltransferase TrmB n=1 Tax=uncultured Campylobacter sp. TaxID=218934 RepID=UPI00261FCAB8|nr:tRNA (guanosine(46)-N7)-methyltransferase TrmB [uncultured Campylobacter sp.]